jgi:hypothetical protein
MIAADFFTVETVSPWPSASSAPPVPECLDWLLILGKTSSRAGACGFMAHYNRHGPHRSRNLTPPNPKNHNVPRRKTRLVHTSSNGSIASVT